MSMNLALFKDGTTNHEVLYQTPSNVSFEVMESENPFKCYKQWLVSSRYGKLKSLDKEHLDKVEMLINNGYEFIIV